MSGDGGAGVWRWERVAVRVCGGEGVWRWGRMAVRVCGGGGAWRAGGGGAQ